MKLSLAGDSQAYVISAYREGEFTVRGQVYTGSHIIRPDQAPVAWSLQNILDLNSDSFAMLGAKKTETVIIGTGNSLVFPDDQWLEHFYRHSIGFEIMDTAAACRTYNILVSEERQVMAALIAV